MELITPSNHCMVCVKGKGALDVRYRSGRLKSEDQVPLVFHVLLSGISQNEASIVPCPFSFLSEIAKLKQDHHVLKPSHQVFKQNITKLKKKGSMALVVWTVHNCEVICGRSDLPLLNCERSVLSKKI